MNHKHVLLVASALPNRSARATVYSKAESYRGTLLDVFESCQTCPLAHGCASEIEIRVVGPDKGALQGHHGHLFHGTPLNATDGVEQKSAGIEHRQGWRRSETF